MEYAKNAEKVQKKAESEWKYQNTWKNEENEYTNSWQRSSSLIAWKISVPSAPFSFNTRTIEFDWEEVTHKYDPDRSFITNYTFSVPQELQQYVDLFNRAIENWYESAIIWEFDWKYIKIYFDKNFKDHFEKHGGFAPENLIMTLNRFDLFSEDVVDWKKRYLFEKELPNGRRLIAVTSTNLTEISFYESKTPKIWRNEKFQIAWDINSEVFKKRFGDWENDPKNANKKAEDNPINTYRKRSRGKVQPASSSEDSIIKNDGNASKNIKNRMKKTDGSSEVSIQSTPTQTNPTFSRTDLGAVLYNRITINEINARYILSIILLDIKFRIINNLFVFIQLILCAKLSLHQTINIKSKNSKKYLLMPKFYH